MIWSAGIQHLENPFGAPLKKNQLQFINIISTLDKCKTGVIHCLTQLEKKHHKNTNHFLYQFIFNFDRAFHKTKVPQLWIFLEHIYDTIFYNALPYIWIFIYVEHTHNKKISKAVVLMWILIYLELTSHTYYPNV